MAAVGDRSPRLGRNGDVIRLFSTRAVRLFAYGALSVVPVSFLAEAGLRAAPTRLLLTLTLLGDTLISLWITTHADRLGRRHMLAAGAALMLLAGCLFALSGEFVLLLAAATVGVISPSGNEVGPFLPIEQSALAQLLPDRRRTGVFAWYNLAGSFATALGALSGGGLAGALQGAGLEPLASYRAVIGGYAVLGALLALVFLGVSPAVEAPTHNPAQAVPAASRGAFGLNESRGIVLRLSALFALDAFGGGFVVQSIVAFWFHRQFGVEPALLGSIFFGANILAGVSALAAGWLARRIGLIRTMVFTHIPSNLLLMLVPLMPTLPLAVGVLLLRFSISQMDVPTRQSYTMAVVRPDERSAAAGITGVARTVGAGLAPVFSGLLMANPALLGAPFLVAGAIKVGYDLLLYASFQAVKPPEEAGA